jgi:hypothetical protein
LRNPAAHPGSASFRIVGGKPVFDTGSPCPSG